MQQPLKKAHCSVVHSSLVVHDCIPNKKQETYLIDNGKNGNHRKDSRGKITSHQFDFEGMAFGISLFYSEAGYAIDIFSVAARTIQLKVTTLKRWDIFTFSISPEDVELWVFPLGALTRPSRP
jgi:hypothetical protein